MEKKIEEIRKLVNKAVDFFDAKEIYGVVSYLEAIYDCLDGANEELENYLADEGE